MIPWRVLRTEIDGVNVPNNIEGNLLRKDSVAPVVLAILDGWGICDSTQHNAIHKASTPIIDALWHAYPHSLIEASGSHVGLPDGQMGNSEVGHLTIGAGRIIRQELVRISETVREQKLGSTPALQSLAERLRSTGGTLHLLGLCSDGGVHSHVNHLCGLLEWAAAEGLENVAIHVITDGRDTPTQSAPKHLTKVISAIKRFRIGRIASLCGRYWAMDRDHRWERTERAYDLLTNPNLECCGNDPLSVLTSSYTQGITDEFLEPVRFSDDPLRDGDALVMFNFRPDRARQIIQALTLPEFGGFTRTHQPTLKVVTFTQYENDL